MKVRAIIATVAIGAVAMGVSAAARGQAGKAAPTKKAAAGRVIEITGDDTMKFSITDIAAKPGEQLTVKIINKGTMPKMAAAHNFVLLKLGTDINAFTTAAVMAQASEYIPTDPKQKGQVLAATKLTGPGESAEVTFKVPTARGAYPYLCSFPGHFATMKGTLTVK